MFDNTDILATEFRGQHGMRKFKQDKFQKVEFHICDALTKESASLKVRNGTPFNKKLQ